MEEISNYLHRSNKKLTRWSTENLPGMLLFNLIIIILVLLHTAGYFLPYFFISINFIFFTGLILAPLILRVNFEALFLLAILFWLSSCILMSFNINAWAERSSIYSFQALFVAVVVLILHAFTFNKKRHVG